MPDAPGSFFPGKTDRNRTGSSVPGNLYGRDNIRMLCLKKSGKNPSYIFSGIEYQYFYNHWQNLTSCCRYAGIDTCTDNSFLISLCCMYNNNLSDIIIQ
jgi:hypothetical protein